MDGKKASIVIVDDHKLFRKGISTLLQDFYFIDEILEAGNGVELLQMLKEKNSLPDVILLDIQMPEMDGVETQKYIRKLYPELKVIILTMEDDEQFILHMIAEGVNGYLLKNADPEELEMALQKVLKNDFYFPANMAQMLLKSSLQKPSSDQIIPEFSEREMEVLDLICREYTAPQIADKLHLSTRTIEGYRGKLLEKTGAKNIAGLVVFAMKNKLIFI